MRRRRRNRRNNEVRAVAGSDDIVDLNKKICCSTTAGTFLKALAADRIISAMAGFTSVARAGLQNGEIDQFDNEVNSFSLFCGLVIVLTFYKRSRKLFILIAFLSVIAVTSSLFYVIVLYHKFDVNRKIRDIVDTCFMAYSFFQTVVCGIAYWRISELCGCGEDSKLRRLKSGRDLEDLYAVLEQDGDNDNDNEI